MPNLGFRILVQFIPTAFVVCVAHDIAVALRLLGAYNNWTWDIGALAFVLGIIVAIRWAFAREDAPLSMAFVAPAAAMYLAARGFVFDDYYAPDLVRYSEHWGDQYFLWIVPLVVAGVGVGVVAWRRRRTGTVLTALVLVPLFLAMAFTAAGH